MSEAHCNDPSDADKLANARPFLAPPVDANQVEMNRDVFEKLKAKKEEIEKLERERNLPKAIFCDIDGTIFRHRGNIADMIAYDAITLPGAQEKFCEWFSKGYKIILTTGRPETSRDRTEQQLRDCKIPYHQLIMDVPIGVRVVINDRKSKGGHDTAVACCVERDKGIADVKI